MAFLSVSGNRGMNSTVFNVINFPVKKASKTCGDNCSYFGSFSTQLPTFAKGISEYVFEKSSTLLFDLKKQSNSGLHKEIYENFKFSHISSLNVLQASLLTNRFSSQQNWSGLPHLGAAVKFVRSNSKLQHLHTQIHSFKTLRHAKHDIPENQGFKNRLKTFFGFGESNNLQTNVKVFQKVLEKENLCLDKNKEALLAFVEGYLKAFETLAIKKSDVNINLSKYFLFSLLMTGCVITFILYLVRSSPLSISFNESIEPLEGRKKFTDVMGADEAKEELKIVVEFLKNPDKFLTLGGKLPKGVLLVGPPGTGKTLLAKAVAGEAGVPFFSTSGSEFEEIYVGVGAKRVRELFKTAKENIPCVIFIDEIDSIGKHRTSSTLHPHANDTINQLLTEMDGFRNTSGIIVLGATNRKEDLDKALLRPGRFDVEVTVQLPDYRGRKELLEFYLKQVRHQDVDIDKLAKGTTSFTGADMENMVNQAALRAAVVGAQYVKTEHLEYARDRALMGPESISRISDEETNRITAVHEAGHTVVAYFTAGSQPLHKVTIVARGAALGHTAYIPDKDVYHISKSEMYAALDVMMGGRAAEELVLGADHVTSGAASDLNKATQLASSMVRHWGMSDAVGLSTYDHRSVTSPQTANLIDREIKRILEESYERAKNILIKHKEKHLELGAALLKYETLDSSEIAAILKGKKPK